MPYQILFVLLFLHVLIMFWTYSLLLFLYHYLQMCRLLKCFSWDLGESTDFCQGQHCSRLQGLHHMHRHTRTRACTHTHWEHFQVSKFAWTCFFHESKQEARHEDQKKRFNGSPGGLTWQSNRYANWKMHKNAIKKQIACRCLTCRKPPKQNSLCNSSIYSNIAKHCI